MTTPSPTYVKRASQMFMRGFVAAQRAAAPSEEASKQAMSKVASSAAKLNEQATNRILGIFALGETVTSAKA